MATFVLFGLSLEAAVFDGLVLLEAVNVERVCLVFEESCCNHSGVSNDKGVR